MAGFQNRIVFSNGQKLQPSLSADIDDMQGISTDVSTINYTGNPEGLVSANPSSTSQDPVSGDIYIKKEGNGNTGWILSNPFPLNVLDMVDDFITSSDAWFSGTLSWQTVGPSLCTGEIDHPGVFDFSKNPGTPQYLFLMGNLGLVNEGNFVLGGGIFSLNYVWKLNQISDMTDTYQVAIGLSDSSPLLAGGAFPITDGVYFQYTDSINSGNWQIITTSASVSTTTNTSVPGDTDWHNFGIIINADATSVLFTIDNSVVGTITTNIPSAVVTPALLHVPSAGAPLGFSIDLFYSRLVLTNSR